MLDDNNSCVSFFFLLGLKVNSWGSLSLEVQFISRSGIEVGFDVRVEIFDTYTLKFCFLPSYTILRALTLVASLTPGRLLMLSYNGILTISCIRTLTQLALKLSGSIHHDHVFQLIKPFRDFKTIWQIRIEASRALLDLEFHCKGMDAALSLFITYLEEEPSLRGQTKLAAHAMRLCQIQDGSDSEDAIKCTTLFALIRLLEGHIGFNNTIIRHHLFCILQILSGSSQG
uniref:Uncharacterized protein n=1 Tax=Salix viminalis TaxID=40686 RepID=A0A6N2KMY1_SALVM